MSQKPPSIAPLKEYGPKNPKNLIFVTNEKQIDDTKKNIKFIAASFCGYSQLGLGQLNSACDDISDEGKCYVFDLDNPRSRAVAEKLKIVPEAFPNHIISDGKGNKKEFLGMLKTPDLRSKLRESGFKV
jgi:hypothetical protein